jgi:sortase A
MGAVLGLFAWQGQNAARAEWEAQAAVKAPPEPRQELTRLWLPAQGAEFFVWEGATRKNLLFGPTHVAESAVPGGNGNCIIAAHRDTHFRMLRDVRKNEPIVVQYGDRTFKYRIVGLHIVGAANNTYYQATATPTLTLVTCYPFHYLGAAPKRFIVQAELTSGS